MKDELRQALQEIASHPASFGVAAAVARWMLGDRSGGWWAFFSYVICSAFVAWGASYYLADELITSGRKTFYLLILAFIAKDLLTAVAAIAAQFRVDPLGVFMRIKAALTGGPRPPEDPRP